MYLNRMTCGELCTRQVSTVLPTTLVDEAARQMRRDHVGCLVVVENLDADRRVVGIVTDRDLVTTVVARGAAPTAIGVGEVMVRDVVCVREEDSIVDLLATIQSRRVRRVPVVGPDQRLVGIVGVDDLLGVLAEQFLVLVQAIGQQRRVERVTRP